MRHVLHILIHEIELGIQLVERVHVVLVDFTLLVIPRGEHHFNQHLHHVRIDRNLVDQSANHAVHVAAVLQLLGERQTLILRFTPSLHSHLQCADLVRHARQILLI